MGEGVSKNIKYCVTSFIDDPLYEKDVTQGKQFLMSHICKLRNSMDHEYDCDVI
jgi:hypothetical protein